MDFAFNAVGKKGLIMIKGIYRSVSGMMPRVLKQETFANNIANVNTAGFKKDGVFLKQLSDAQQGIMTDLEWEIPMVDDVYVDFSQGQVQRTGQVLDIAIEGEGFFVVNTPNGERYTRGGEFALNENGTLIDKNGYEILSDSGPITIVGDKIDINGDGSIAVDDSQVAKLKVVNFDQVHKLHKTDNGYFKLVDGGAAVEADSFQIRQGYIEQSNVSMIDEMVDMIISFRAYEAGQKAIQAQDSTLDKTVNDLGLIR